MNEQQIAIQLAQQAHMMANYTPNIFDALRMANYRPPVSVPEGWAEWFAHGDAVT